MGDMVNRFSVDKDDPGYEQYMIYGHDYDWIVTVNGEVCDSVVTADVDKGFVDRYIKDDDGNYQVDYRRNVIKTERVYGEVNVECRDHGTNKTVKAWTLTL